MEEAVGGVSWLLSQAVNSRNFGSEDIWLRLEELDRTASMPARVPVSGRNRAIIRVGWIITATVGPQRVEQVRLSKTVGRPKLSAH